MLVRGFDAQPELVKRLLGLAPTAQTCSDLGEVRQASWDFLVTDRPLTDVGNHLCAVYVCPKLAQGRMEVVEDRIEWPMAIVATGGHICQEWKRVKALP